MILSQVDMPHEKLVRAQAFHQICIGLIALVVLPKWLPESSEQNIVAHDTASTSKRAETIV
ncbi:hypothetical protein BJ994_002872 [Arthrobacter pigmenti]|uniref:Uncharacterized protein n=1 Tax=Arthrobacter pigmenti TaxID=271432 RepID=A0A846RXT7_9MICC|nr:hypothetical protein [Arthrobacter pigmenti]